jgi:protein-(glutamine-N5) methyltransferase, release factor-specific
MLKPMADRPQQLRRVLRDAERLISATGSDEARLEAELLVIHALGIDRVHLYQQLEEEIAPADSALLRSLLNRRLAHEPTPYIVGHKEFFGLDFKVSPVALVPRPETETLVELVVAFSRERFGDSPFTVADIGCGCGIICVSLAHALPSAQAIATDINQGSLDLTGRNAERHGVQGRVRLALGDLLDPLSSRVDIIAANLPYVTTAEWGRLPPEIREHEPRSGLDGGPDGLRLIARLIEEAPAHLRPGGALFEEIGDEQGAAVAELARNALPNARISIEKDLAGRDRVLLVQLPT